MTSRGGLATKRGTFGNIRNTGPIETEEVKVGQSTSEQTIIKKGDITSVGGTANLNNLVVNGNVGIGTTSPTSDFQISNNMYFDKSIVAGGNVGSTDPGPRLLLHGQDPHFKLLNTHSVNGAGSAWQHPYFSVNVHNNNVKMYAPAGVDNYASLFLYVGATYGWSTSPELFVQFWNNWNTAAANRIYFTTGEVHFNGAVKWSSDDRLKHNETNITNAVATLCKLRPQKYDRKYETEGQADTFIPESGLIAQEVYYDAPELRHLVEAGTGGTPAETIETSTDPTVDPDYSSWGSEMAALNYTGLIPYLISAIKEQQGVITTLEAKTATLEATVSSQQTTINDLVARITALENA